MYAHIFLLNAKRIYLIVKKIISKAYTRKGFQR